MTTIIAFTRDLLPSVPPRELMAGKHEKLRELGIDSAVRTVAAAHGPGLTPSRVASIWLEYRCIPIGIIRAAFRVQYR